MAASFTPDPIQWIELISGPSKCLSQEPHETPDLVQRFADRNRTARGNRSFPLSSSNSVTMPPSGPLTASRDARTTAVCYFTDVVGCHSGEERGVAVSTAGTPKTTGNKKNYSTVMYCIYFRLAVFFPSDDRPSMCMSSHRGSAMLGQCQVRSVLAEGHRTTRGFLFGPAGVLQGDLPTGQSNFFQAIGLLVRMIGKSHDEGSRFAIEALIRLSEGSMIWEGV